VRGKIHYLLFPVIFIFSIQRLHSQDSLKVPKVTSELSGNFRVDYRYFPDEALYPGQFNQYWSGYFEPKVYLKWNKGKQLLQFSGFGRLDQYDTASTHVDLRELYWQALFKKSEISVGFKKIFWGITESNHVVDVVNQLDALEGFDIEQKLGQPMVHFSWSPKWGTIDVIGMAYHRQLLFPGPNGRPRPPLGDPTANSGNFHLDSTIYESEYNEYQPEIALRWSHSVSIFDIGLTYFNGTTRPPLFATNDGIHFNIFYELINQVGIDIQAYTGSMLWKFEGAYRESNRKAIRSFVVGGEYTFSNLFRSGADLGFIVEYNYDDRGIELLTALDDDMFYGLRFALNDRQSTDFLGGYIVDNDNGTQRYFLEANRRLGNSWKLSINASGYNNVAQTEFIYLLRADGFIGISLYKYL